MEELRGQIEVVVLEIADLRVMWHHEPAAAEQWQGLMMRTLDRTNLNMAMITDDLRELSDRINRPQGLVYLLSDTVLAAQVRGSIS